MEGKQHWFLFYIILVSSVCVSNNVSPRDGSISEISNNSVPTNDYYNSKIPDKHCKENRTCVRVCCPGSEFFYMLPPEGCSYPFAEHPAINITFQREDGKVVNPDRHVQLVEGDPMTCYDPLFLRLGYVLPNGYFFFVFDEYYFTPQEYCLVISSLNSPVNNNGTPTIFATTCDRNFCPKNATCVRKCCPGTKVINYYKDGSTECMERVAEEPKFNISFKAEYEKDNTENAKVYLQYGGPKCFDKSFEMDTGYILPNGHFLSTFYNHTYEPKKYCLDILRKDDKSAAMQAFTCYREYCKENSKCVRKCCGASHIWSSVDPRGCTDPLPHEPSFSMALFQPQDDHFEYEEETQLAENLPLHLLYGDPTCRLIKDKGYILRSGSFYSTDNMKTYDYNKYCVDMFRAANSTYMQAFTCWELPESFAFYYDNAATGARIVSVIALTILILWHAVITELRDLLQSKCMLNHVISLHVTFITYLSLEFWVWERQDNFCLIVVILLHSATIATFLWLTIMCYDVWRLFRLKAVSRPTLKQKRRRWFMYSAVAWGLTLVYAAVLTVITFIPDNTFSFYIIRPVCVNLKYDHLTFLLYYSGVIGVLSCINVYFLSSTIVVIYSYGVPICGIAKTMKITEDSRVFQQTNYIVTFWQRFQLFVVMTLLWPAAAGSEVLSSLVQPWQLWAVALFLNKLQGLIILIIFLRSPSKRKLVLMLMERCLLACRSYTISQQYQHTAVSSIKSLSNTTSTIPEERTTDTSIKSTSSTTNTNPDETTPDTSNSSTVTTNDNSNNTTTNHTNTRTLDFSTTNNTASPTMITDDTIIYSTKF